MGADGILRSITADLIADTPFSREMEIQAGPEVAQRLEVMGELPLGAAVITPGGGLPSEFLIHVVLQSGEEAITPSSLRAGVENGLRRAEEWGLEILALPCLGTGVGKLDAPDSARVVIPSLLRRLGDSQHLREMVVLAATDYEREAYEEVLAQTGTSGPPRPDAPPHSPLPEDGSSEETDSSTDGLHGGWPPSGASG
jgi:O-acetyl-ADP-ribose deacetylase (regulator of RNase III)